MRRSATARVLSAALIAVAAAACEHSVTQPDTFGSTPNVAVGNNFFEPKVDTVEVGTTVTWTNNGETHTVTSDTGLWDSGNLGHGKTFTHTFDQAGTFPYHCTIHGSPMKGMAGTIVVR